MPGSGDMMLTGGVEEADGNSALVGLPLAPGEGTIAAAAATLGGGAFQEDA